jgi:transposase
LNRWAVVVLSRDGRNKVYIARHLDINRKSVTAILARYEATGRVGSGGRTGRPRATDEETDHNIVLTAHVDKFTSPRQVRRKLDLDVSPRTVDRRMQEGGLFGRVARHKFDYTPEHIRQRLSFAHGHSN